MPLKIKFSTKWIFKNNFYIKSLIIQLIDTFWCFSIEPARILIPHPIVRKKEKINSHNKNHDNQQSIGTPGITLLTGIAKTHIRKVIKSAKRKRSLADQSRYKTWICSRSKYTYDEHTHKKVTCGIISINDNSYASSCCIW